MWGQLAGTSGGQTSVSGPCDGKAEVIEDLTSVAADSERIIMLGGYAAKRCAVRTHNDFAPLVPVPELEPSAELQADFDAGIAFEGEVLSELLRIHRSAKLAAGDVSCGECR
jgi:hypothetical protein